MIDTAEKRKSVAALLVIFGPGVTSNAAKDAEWRQQAGWSYSGIAPLELLPCYFDVLSGMRDTAVSAQGAMSDDPIEVTAELC